MPSLIRVGVPAVVGAAAWALARQARTATVRDRLRAHDVRTTSWLPAAVRAPLLRSLERAGVQTEPVIAVQVWAIAVGAAIAISLPFGATFVIGPGDVVRYTHIDRDSTDHAPLDEVLAALA